ncbi:MAG TPA: DegV family protein [Eubacteriales bacterium]|nr:DegV family protein [Eubacteriales bacterium]
MKIKFTADSVIDLTPSMLTENDITLIPLHITLGEENFIDGVDVTPDDIYAFVAKTNILPKTAAVSVEKFKSEFSKYVDEGYTVIHFDISSEMSASNSNAKIAAAEVGNVYVIDSRNLSAGVGVLVLYACDLRAKGLGAKTIYEKVLKRIPYVQASFIIDRLDYLHKGGRCSSVALLGANLMGIKPTIEVKNGNMGVGKKYVGTLKKVIEKFVINTLKDYPNYDKKRIFIGHTVIDEAILEKTKNLIQQHADFEEIHISDACCTITSHCGPGTLGLFYINDGGVEN